MPEVKVPELAESITEGTIAEWLKNVGDSVDKGEAILELETDKVNVEVVSEEAGVLSEQLAEEGDTVEVGQAVAVVGEGSGNASSGSSEDTPQKDESKDAGQTEDKSEQKQASSDNKQDSQDTNNQRVNATPSARRHARENGVNLSEVSGKGNDVLRKDDVDNSQKQASQPAKSESKSQDSGSKKSNDNPSKPVIREKMSRRKKTAAKKLLEVSNQTAMLTTFNEVDMTNVMELRKRKKEQFMKDHDGTKLGFMSFFTKAAVAALKKS